MPRRINLALVIKKLSLHCIICSESKILYFHHAFSIEKISLDAFFAIKLLWERVAHDGQAVIGQHICVPVSLVSWFCISLIQRPLSMLGATDLSLIFLSEAHRKFRLLISCTGEGRYSHSLCSGFSQIISLDLLLYTATLIQSSHVALMAHEKHLLLQSPDFPEKAILFVATIFNKLG